MKVVSVGSPDAVEQARKVILEGGLVVFPTDTAYGLGADATNNAAVKKLYELKGRDSTKPIHVVVGDIAMADHYVVVNKQARMIAGAFLPGPLTLVLKDKHRVSSMIVSEKKTLGIRIPDSDFAHGLAARARTPITATSANRSGDLAPYSVDEVRQSFGEDSKHIDLMIDAGKLPKVLPSTLIDVSTSVPKILREGPVGREELLAVLQ